MLRLMVLVLLLLNVGYYARGQGWLLAYGWGPTPQHEPQRLAQQIRPEALEILPSPQAPPAIAGPAASAPEPAVPASAPQPAASSPELAASATLPESGAAVSEPASTACWQVTDIDPVLAEALRSVLRVNFPEGVWVLDELGLPERWMVYMGKYANPTDLAKKREQLTELKVKFSQATNPAWVPGLSLGVFTTQEGANTHLQELTQRGVRSARVVQERPSSRHYRLRLPAISAAEQPALEAVKAALAGKPLEACPVPAAESAAQAASGSASVTNPASR